MVNVAKDWSQAPFVFSMGEEIAPEIPNTILPLVEKVGLAGGRLLDLGCLDGRNTVPLAQSGFFSEVVGTDMYWSRRHLKKLVKKNLPNLTIFEIQEDKNYPLASNSFEVVLVWRVIHCFLDFEERKNFIRQAFDFVSPGGLLVLSVRKWNKNENYHCIKNSDRVLICERFENDISRVYYSALSHLLREVNEAISRSASFSFEFEEFEVRKNSKKDVIPCLGVVIQK